MERALPERKFAIELACVAGGISCASAFVLVAKPYNVSGKALRGLVKSRVEFLPAQIRGFFLIMHSPVHANFGLAESIETSIKC